MKKTKRKKKKKNNKKKHLLRRGGARVEVAEESPRTDPLLPADHGQPW